jgi:RHS repeat-associated protein
MGSNWSSGSVPGSSDTVAISTTSPATITIQAGDAITIQSLTTGNNDTLSFTGGSLTITSSSTLNGPLTLTAGTLTASGSAITVTAAGATTLSGVSLFAEAGATLSLPGLTSYNTTGTSNNIFQAQGAGSVLSLPALASVTASNSFIWHVNALSGGTVNLSGLTSIFWTGYSTIISDGTGSIVLLPASPTFIGPSGTIAVNDGASIQFGSNAFTMPSSGTGLTINVPQLPAGVTLNLGTTGTFSGGTTFNVPAGDSISLNGRLLLDFGAVSQQGAGSYTGGVTFNVGAGATADLTGDEGGEFIQSLSYSGTLTASGSGTVQLSGGWFDVGLSGLTLNFAGNTFQWTGGEMSLGQGDVTNLGTLNLSGPNDKIVGNGGALDNFGTLTQTGTGNLSLHVNGTTFENEPGASYLIESDSGIDNLLGYTTAVINQGTIRKTAGTGTSTLVINGPLSNAGTIEADSGTLFVDANSISQLSGTTLVGGSWNALNGSTLEFPNGSNITNNEGTVSLSGNGAAFAALAGLAANSGNFSLTNGANFTAAGSFTNSGTLTVGAGSTLTIPGSFTQTSTGILDEQIGGAPSSGQYGQVKVTGAATPAGQFGVALVKNFTATVGEAFQPLTFSSVTGGFNNFTGLAPTFTQALNATNLTLTATDTSIDLDLLSVTAPTTATAGQSITVTWQVSNPTNLDLIGSWLDSIYLSPTLSITSSSILLGSKQETNLQAKHSYGASLSVPLTDVPPGFYYVLVDVDSLYQVPDPNRANNIVAASGQINVSLPTLTLGTPASGSFTAADQDQDYQVTVPVGGALTVSLSSTASSGALALYIGQGTLPTAANNQGAAAIANQPNQTLIVPQVLNAGTYFILVHSISGTAATANYTLTASQSSALAVTAISSYAGGNAGNVTIEIDGTIFTSSTTASLTLGSATINASAIDFVSASQLFATFNLTGAAVGNYTLKVQRGASSATAPTPFQVVSANPGIVTLGLSLPQFVRSGRTGTVVINYANNTNNDLVAPFLTVSSADPLVLFSPPGNPNDFLPEVQLLAVAPSGPAGILRPGQSGQLSLTLLNEDPTDGANLPVNVSPIPTGNTINWPRQEAGLQPSTFSAGAWNIVFNNLLAIIGSTTDSYNAALAQAATYLSGLGESTDLPSSVDNLWSFLVSQANAALPTSTLASAVDASLPSPGNLSLSLDRTFGSSIADRNQPGLFGLSWSTSWDTSLSVDGSGNVGISSGGDYGYFVAQPNGSYLDTSGEYGTLSNSGGVFTFTDTDGRQSVYLANGKLNYVQDTNGNRITLDYNSSNKPTTLTFSNPSNPSEPTEQLALTYNSQGFVSQIADGTGNTWLYNYDGAGHLLSVTGPGNLTTTYTYDTGTNPETANALLSITYPDGSQRNFTYDPATGRLTGTSENGGADPITYTYITEAEIAAKDANGDITTVWYNDLGLAARIQDPLGAVSSYQFDANGNPISYTNAAGQTYQYTYDSEGNLTQVIKPLGQTVAMSYGPLDTLTSITDAAGNTTQYSYDSAGNLRSIIYPDGTKQSFTYDPLGNLSQTVLQNGDPIAYQYNAQGLVTSETLADGSTRTFTYDAHGNLLTAKDSTGTTTLTYNAANQLTSVTYPNGLSLTFTYNAQGQRTKSVDQSGFTVNYSYDSLGRLSKLTDGSGNLIVQYTYNNLGQLTRKDNGNGTYTTYSYDVARNLLSIVNYAGGTTINSSFTYTYNQLGEVISVTDNAAGDHTGVITNGTPTNYASNVDNEITQVGSATYNYDANGNPHAVVDSSGTTTYNYNDLSQLLSITAPDGTTTSLQYNPLGFLVGTTTSNGSTTNETNYLVDPTGLGNVVGAFTSSASVIAHYLFGLGLVSQTGPGGTGFYDFDASSSTVGITGASGTYVNQYSYLPFGETTTGSSSLANPFTFVGQVGVLQIGNNLFSMRARDYSPSSAQFMSNDPLGLGGGDFNLRRYVFNDPVNVIDPSGQNEEGGEVLQANSAKR